MKKSTFFISALSLIALAVLLEAAASPGKTPLCCWPPQELRAEPVTALSDTCASNGFGVSYDPGTTGEHTPTTVHSGDLTINGSDVFVITDETFNINGSIVVEENATLILRNASLNFVQTESLQFNMIFKNPVNGNPRLVVNDSSISSNKPFTGIYFYGNSSATLTELSTSFYLFLQISSVASVWNSTVERIQTQQFATLTATNSSFVVLSASDSSRIVATDCTINVVVCEEDAQFVASHCAVTSHIEAGIEDGNYTVIDLKPGFAQYWNFQSNCSATITPSGWIPNVTLIDCQIAGWGFFTRGNSHGDIHHSHLWSLWAYDSASIHIHTATVAQNLWGYQSSSTHISNVTAERLFSYENSSFWLLNATANAYYVYDESQVYLSWYLNVHVVDSLGQDVPAANITAAFSNLTVAAVTVADSHGKAKLPLAEGVLNETGRYLVGDYSLGATYLGYSDETTVSMTGNQQATLTLEGFVIPEVPSLFILLPFMVAALLAAEAYRRSCLHARDM